MTRAFQLLIGISVLAAGALIRLWGLFFVLYRGDEGSGEVYIGDVDAQVIGAIALAVGLPLIWISVRLLRSQRRRLANQSAKPS